MSPESPHCRPFILSEIKGGLWEQRGGAKNSIFVFIHDWDTWFLWGSDSNYNASFCSGSDSCVCVYACVSASSMAAAQGSVDSADSRSKQTIELLCLRQDYSLDCCQLNKRLVTNTHTGTHIHRRPYPSITSSSHMCFSVSLGLQRTKTSPIICFPNFRISENFFCAHSNWKCLVKHKLYTFGNTL